MPTIYDNIAAGKYQQTGDYPDRPPQPAVLRKAAGTLTDTEAALLAATKRNYEAALADFVEARAAWQRRDNALVEAFWNDVAEDYGWDRSDAFVQKIEGIAWRNGHSGGFSDVYSELSDLAELYDIYKGASDVD